MSGSQLAPQIDSGALGCHRHRCMDSPEELLGQIESRDDFLHFLDALGADCQALEAAERSSP